MILSFAKPKKIRSSEEHASMHSSDTGIPGTYVSNMSDTDRKTWKAKVVGSKSGNHQIEIRSEKPRANAVVVVNGLMPNEIPAKKWVKAHYATPGEIKMSANGPMHFDPATWNELYEAVTEARAVLVRLDDPKTRKETLATVRRGDHPFDD